MKKLVALLAVVVLSGPAHSEGAGIGELLGQLCELSMSAPPSRSDQTRPEEAIANPLPSSLVQESLWNAQETGMAKLLTSAGDYQVLIGMGAGLPAPIMYEVGRTREVTFRGEGEGSLKSLDVDSYDPNSLQMIGVFQNRQVAGGYRIFHTNPAVAAGRLDQIYSNRQFNFDPRFFQKLTGDVYDIGRSFVVDEHKGSGLLNLFWKGYAKFLLNEFRQGRHPRYLIGPTSISNRFTPLEQTLIVDFLKRHYSADAELKTLISPKNGFSHEITLSRATQTLLQNQIQNFKDLENLLRQVNPAVSDLPPLVVYYPRILGAKYIGFDFDPEFGSLDGLIVVDLYKIPLATMRRFFNSPDEAAEFQGHLNASFGSGVIDSP